jgi:hypothetical protein
MPSAIATVTVFAGRARTKDEVLAELMAERVALKKDLGEL